MSDHVLLIYNHATVILNKIKQLKRATRGLKLIRFTVKNNDFLMAIQFDRVILIQLVVKFCFNIVRCPLYKHLHILIIVRCPLYKHLYILTVA